MRFRCSITINKPKDQIVEYFSNPAYLKEYQEGFIRKQHISGEEGQTGAISQMYYKMGKGEMVLTETIIQNNLPDSFLAQYHHKHTDNTMKSSFTELNKNTTRYDAEIEYTAFRGFVVKLMAKLFPGFFKKQVQKWMEKLKAFAEQQS